MRAKLGEKGEGGFRQQRSGAQTSFALPTTRGRELAGGDNSPSLAKLGNNVMGARLLKGVAGGNTLAGRAMLGELGCRRETLGELTFRHRRR